MSPIESHIWPKNLKEKKKGKMEKAYSQGILSQGIIPRRVTTQPAGIIFSRAHLSGSMENSRSASITMTTCGVVFGDSFCIRASFSDF